ncbi:MAG: formate dehydrogenase subunit alpha [Chloroflexota bacterium]|nr:formate dehydrogenase subunit alpha [Chloroflexota bacterium]
MDTITITMNGREVSGQQGMTVLDLARESGIEIPTLCNDPWLEPVGACRICLVEEERRGVLLASCVTPIMQGMVINTESTRVQERRKTIVELMLASHPDSCLVCDKGNRCALRRIASEIGIGLLSLQKIPQHAEITEVNPFIERDMSKCILCSKCIRADQELVVEGALDYIDRGFAARPSTFADAPLEKSECTFCGTCVAMCPTGALIERDRPHRLTAQKAVNTICPFCGCGCGISLEVRGNHVVRSIPSQNGSVNKGATCVKGSYGYDFINSPERLTNPLLKVEDEFQEVSWDTALAAIAFELNKAKENSGPNSLAFLGCSKCTNEENYLFQWFARTVIGTNNIDNGSRLYSSAGLVGLGSSIGFPGTTNPLCDIEQSEVIFVIGADPTTSAPLVGYAIKRAIRRKNAKLILADPRQTKLHSFAHKWLRPKLATDVVLINGMAKLIIDKCLIDQEHVDRRTDNFEAFRESLSQYTPEYVEAETGICASDVQQAAYLFAEATQASIVYGNGVTQQIRGSGTVTALANLAMLTGNIGRRHGGIYALQRDCNAQGACDMGSLPDFLPGYQTITDDQARKRFEELWQTPIPSPPGLTVVEMLKRAKDGMVKAMYIIGENPAEGFPDSTLVRQALSNLDFLVVQDLFMTPTAKLANIVLPAASFAEKDGTFTNFEGRVQNVQKVIDPIGNSLPDWEIIIRLATQMGHSVRFSSPRQVDEEIKASVPLYQDTAYSSEGIGQTQHDRFGNSKIGTRRLYKGQFPNGFERFTKTCYTPQEQTSQNGYAFELIIGTTLYQFGSGVRISKSPRLNKFRAHSFVEICKSDAQQLGIEDGDDVRITSQTASLVSPALVSNTVPQGILYMPMASNSCNAASLFSVQLDPQSKTPSFKSCAVKIERIESHG